MNTLSKEWIQWLGQEDWEEKLDTLIDFTVALMEDPDLSEEDEMLHANALAVQLGFSNMVTQHIIHSVLETYSKSIMIQNNKSYMRATRA